MIIETAFKQGSDEWLMARLGSVGGTGVSNIITSTGNPSKSREAYLYEMASQIITKKSKPVFKTFEMQWGNDHEAEARELFSFLKGFEIEQCAMIWADENKNHHISPDGMIDRQAGLEIKCPQLKAHDEYLKDGILPTQYKLQVQTSLAVTGWDVWWFMSYFPEVQPLIIPVERDEKLIRTIKIEVALFLEDLEKLINRLRR